MGAIIPVVVPVVVVETTSRESTTPLSSSPTLCDWALTATLSILSHGGWEIFPRLDLAAAIRAIGLQRHMPVPPTRPADPATTG
jgi:hypothetical protein